LGGPNQDVRRETDIGLQKHFDRLVEGLSLKRHDDQKVHIGILRYITSRVRAKKDHALGVELPDNSLDGISNFFHGDHAASSQNESSSIIPTARI